MDTLAVLAIKEYFDRRFSGERILGLITVARDVFALTFRGVPGGVIFRMANPPAVYYDDSSLKPSRDYPPLSDAALLEGVTLQKVEQYGDDRIIRFVLERDGAILVLVVELFRRPPSVYLVSADGKTTTIYGRRLNGDYVYPPDTTGGKVAFNEINIGVIEDILGSDNSAQILKEKISHLSPRVAEYLAEKNAGYIRDVFNANDTAIRNGSGVVQYTGNRWAAYPAVVFDEYETKQFDDINRAVRFAVTETDRVQSLGALKATIGRSLRNRKKKLLKQVEILSRELAEYEEPEKIRELGDLLKANFARIKRGQKSIVVANFFTGDETEIELNPASSPEANMEAYYKRYRKALRGEEKVRKRLALIENEMADIEVKIQKVDEAAAIDDIVDMSPISKQERVKQAAAVIGRRYLSSDGFEIVVGRGAKENDAVTFGVGRPGDLWLHARESRGSHVIVRRKEKGKPFPKRTIEEAAALAGYFSKSRNAEIVPVIVTERRYVARIKGSPGLVRVMQEEVIFAEPGEVLKPGMGKR